MERPGFSWRRLMMKTALILIRGRIPFVALCLACFAIIIIQGKYSVVTKTRVSDADKYQKTRLSTQFLDSQKKNAQTTQKHQRKPSSTSLSIAIGCAITSIGIRDLRPDNTDFKFPFLRTFLSSFCKTASLGYDYHFYLAFDRTDPYLTQRDSLHDFSDSFKQKVENHCPKTSNYTLHFVECSHSGKPAWAQNDAMMDAYLDDCEYYYRVNDDSLLETAGWTEQLIEALRNQTPPNVGVAGPTHSGGNEDILTQDFVHKTHIDIFGFYYPRLFSDWWADDWMTLVYQPNRMSKVPGVKVAHTQERGTRYKPRLSVEQSLMDRVQADQRVLHRFLSSNVSHPDPEKVISICLWGDNPRYTYGALRNAQLSPIFFPGWTLRIYTEKHFSDGLFRYSRVPDRILDKLESLGAEVLYVDTSRIQVSPMMWRFLVADDMTVEWFIVRDADGRLSDRDAEVVQDWLNSSAPFHCIRDHPSHAGYRLLGGMWGGRPRLLKEVISLPWEGMMRGVGEGYGADMDFLAQVIYPKVASKLMCHDSMSCTSWPNSHPFPLPRRGTEHVGQIFDAFGNPRDEDIDILLGHGSPASCTAGNFSSSALAVRQQKLVLPAQSARYVLWSMNYHSGPIRALKDLLSGSSIDFVTKTLSENCAEAKSCASDIDAVTAENALQPTEEDIKEFRQQFRESTHMEKVTHFICFDPPSLCELYMTLNKSLLVVTTSRYEKGRVSKQHWEKWNRNLMQIARDSHNVVAATNKYDKAYITHFTGIRPRLLPTFCGYTRASYMPTRSGYLVYPISNSSFAKQFMNSLTLALRDNSTAVFHLRTLYPHYEFTDVAAHRGIVYVPNQVSTMNFCEHYQMNIPMFFPSLQLLVKWHLQYRVLNRLTLNAARKLHSFTAKGSPIQGADNSTDPNKDWDRHSLEQWLKLADFYQWPHVVYYKSVSDLAAKLLTTDLQETSLGMQAYNDKQRASLKDTWLTLLAKTYSLNKFKPNDI